MLCIVNLHLDDIRIIEGDVELIPLAKGLDNENVMFQVGPHMTEQDEYVAKLRNNNVEYDSIKLVIGKYINGDSEVIANSDGLPFSPPQMINSIKLCRKENGIY